LETLALCGIDCSKDQNASIKRQNNHLKNNLVNIIQTAFERPDNDQIQDDEKADNCDHYNLEKGIGREISNNEIKRQHSDQKNDHEGLLAEFLIFVRVEENLAAFPF